MNITHALTVAAALLFSGCASQQDAYVDKEQSQMQMSGPRALWTLFLMQFTP